MSEKAALAHTKLLGERTHGKPFQALSGGDIDGACKDSFAGAEPLGLAADDRLAAALVDGLAAGTRAKSVGHENTVTQNTNKHERSFVVVCSPHEGCSMGNAI